MGCVIVKMRESFTDHGLVVGGSFHLKASVDNKLPEQGNGTKEH